MVEILGDLVLEQVKHLVHPMTIVVESVEHELESVDHVFDVVMYHFVEDWRDIEYRILDHRSAMDYFDGLEGVAYVNRSLQYHSKEYDP